MQTITMPTEQNPHAGMGVYVVGHYVERRGPLNPSVDIGRNLNSERDLAADLFLLDGNSNQVVCIVPSLSLVVARFGNRPPRDPVWDNARLPNRLIRGLPDAARAHLSPQPE
ncbi:MAG: hypothetical protein AB8G16_18480 [Gammaproteobacteria bacterium]